MKTKLIIGVLLLFAALLILPAAAEDASVPTLPLQVYGTVTDLNGGVVPVGTVVTATVDGLTSTYTVKEAGKIGGAGTFGGKFLIKGTTTGSTVSFKIGDKPAVVPEGCTFVSGAVKQIELVIGKEVTKDVSQELKDTFKEPVYILNPETGEVPSTLKLKIVSDSAVPEKPKEAAAVFKTLEITLENNGVSVQKGYTVFIPITITQSELREYFNGDAGNIGIFHYTGSKWEEVQKVKTETSQTTGDVVVTVRIDSFSPFMIAKTQPADPSPEQTPSPSTGGGSKSNTQGQTPVSAVTQTPAPAARTPVPVVGDTSSVKPTDNPAQQPKSPAPILGILAGLGAAAVLLAARQRR